MIMSGTLVVDRVGLKGHIKQAHGDSFMFQKLKYLYFRDLEQLEYEMIGDNLENETNIDKTSDSIIRNKGDGNEINELNGNEGKINETAVKYFFILISTRKHKRFSYQYKYKKLFSKLHKENP